ncbi:MAG: HPr family phosphocarrier protein [bacterium]
MTRREVTIHNKLGIHARPASRIVKLATLSRADFWLVKNGERVNGKSILSVMMLAAACGERVILEANGEGEAELIQEVADLIQKKFGEE